MRTNKREYLSEDEYLRFEQNSAIKHEYVDGRVFAMSGSTKRHALIQMNIANALHNFLMGGPCRVYMEVMKLKIDSARCFYYPDVMVVCQELKDLDELYEESPALVLEVLSRSTASVDRREKFTNYTKIPSLQEYVLVHQQRRKVELHRRNNEGSWDEFIFQGNESVTFKSVPGELKLTMDVIYRDIPDADNLKVKEDTPDYLLSENDLYELSW